MTSGRSWWPRSLRRQLILGVTTVVSVVLLAVGAVSVMILRSYVTNMVDSEVSRSLDAVCETIVKAREHHDPGPRLTIPTADEPLAAFIGHAQGNIIALLRDGGVVEAAVFSRGEPTPAPPDALRDIETQSWSDGPPRTVELAGLASYRMQSRTIDGGDVIVSGVSLEQAHAAIAQKTLITGGLIVVALVFTAGATFLVVRYALRPLRRVAATAAQVATSPLADDHRITARVPATDTDPDNEVGVVGEALNRLLANVDSALTERMQSDQRMRRFLTDASHEIRTPLAAIQGYAELTRQDSSVLPETTEYALARIESEARRLASLVDELLLLSRLDEKQDLDTEVVDLVDLTIDAVNDAAVTGPDHRWVTELPDDAVWVRGDRARLHQLISNLLTNARVHTPAGVTVTTAITRDTEYAELSVIDDGPDIAADLLPHLFERFVKADAARSHAPGTSTGLGLAIVASIVEAHDGCVTAESGNGRTAFRVRLPIIASDDASTRQFASLHSA